MAAASAKPEAEADPALLYAGYYGHPYGHGAGYYGYGAGYYGYAGHYGYAGLKSAPCVNSANQPVPCAAGYAAPHYIGKRSADSEAEADPAYFAVPTAYGAGYGYGYGYPYGYAHGAALVHTSHFGVCTNYVGARVPC